MPVADPAKYFEMLDSVAPALGQPYQDRVGRSE